jgi:ribonuclease HI
VILLSVNIVAVRGLISVVFNDPIASRALIMASCSNNQAEQLAIIKALEAIGSLNTTESNPRTATIFTDSRITLDSLQNANNHAYLIEEIRKRVAILERSEWKIEFSWAKAHVRIYGNEMADRLAKEAARKKDSDIAFNRISKSTINYELEEESKQQWQHEWENYPKAATTKEYFPTVQDRLNTKISMTPNIAAMLTGHGKTRAYLHRFKLLEQATCVCKHGDHTVDHVMYHCSLLQKQRDIMKQNILKTGNWPASERELMTIHRDCFITFV